MTIFLCLLALIALWQTPRLTGTGPITTIAIWFLYTVLVLGLAALACWSWWVKL